MSVLTVSLSALGDPRESESRPEFVKLQDSLRMTGTVLFKDHPIDPMILAIVHKTMRKFTALPLEVKKGYERPEIG